MLCSCLYLYTQVSWAVNILLLSEGLYSQFLLSSIHLLIPISNIKYLTLIRLIDANNSFSSNLFIPRSNQNEHLK